MRCQEFRTFIQTYLDHELSREIEAEWRQHLEECCACRAKVRGFEKCLAMMRRFMGDEMPPKRLRERMKQRLGFDCFDFCNFPPTAQRQKKDDREKP
jgi:predicted anti-sigma-YlaC factor YlaD